MAKGAWLLISVLLTVVAFSIDGTDAATTQNLKRLHFKRTHDHFWNYDFGRRSSAEADPPPSDGVDWHMSLLFRNGAKINRVHNLLRDLENGGYGYKEHGDPIYARLNDGAGWKVDESDGRKGRFCPVFGETSHYRIYAPRPPDFMAAGKFRLDLGHYVLGTIHKDHNECGGGAWAGMSEDAEDELARDYAKRWGRRLVRRHTPNLNWENPEDGPNEDGHLWQSDGYATFFRLP
jgi:hypothetical protein